MHSLWGERDTDYVYEVPISHNEISTSYSCRYTDTSANCIQDAPSGPQATQAITN